MKRISLVDRAYAAPFVFVASLFFLWGFARTVTDVLNKHFQTTAGISISQSTLVQGVFFLGYFLLAVPAGIFISRRGYRAGIVLGLLLFGAGALLFGGGSLLFHPARQLPLFHFFLFTLFMSAGGLVFLETAANPYMTRLGDPATAAGRLNLAQSVNGLGNICGPLVGGLLFFGGAAEGGVSFPYMVMGVVVLLGAVVFSRLNLPEMTEEEADGGQAGGQSLLRNRMFLFGFVALLFYEVAEISINSLFVNYAGEVAHLLPADASKLLSAGLVLFMCARFLGAWVMSRVPASRVLLVCSVCTVVSCCLVFANLGRLSVVALMANFAFEAIMFPTIFSLALRGLGGQTKRAASYLMLSTIGGAVGTMLMGAIADAVTLSFAFVVPLSGFVVVAFYSFKVTTAMSGQAPKRKGSPT